MRKPVYAICDQQQRHRLTCADLISTFVVRCLDSTIPLLAITEISRLAGLSLTWSQTPKTVFSWHGSTGPKQTSISFNKVHYNMSHDITKPTMWVCAQQRVRAAWASAQSDLSLRWTHMPFCWFCKTNNVSVRPAKTRISLGIRPVWSVSSLGAYAILLVLSCCGSHGFGNTWLTVGPQTGIYDSYSCKTYTFCSRKQGLDNNITNFDLDPKHSVIKRLRVIIFCVTQKNQLDWRSNYNPTQLVLQKIHWSRTNRLEL